MYIVCVTNCRQSLRVSATGEDADKTVSVWIWWTVFGLSDALNVMSMVWLHTLCFYVTGVFINGRLGWGKSSYLGKTFGACWRAVRFNFITALPTVTPNQSTDGMILSDFNEPEGRRRHWSGKPLSYELDCSDEPCELSFWEFSGQNVKKFSSIRICVVCTSAAWFINCYWIFCICCCDEKKT